MDEEKRAEFDRIIGLNPDTAFNADDPLIPEELQGIEPPDWWKATPTATEAQASWAVALNPGSGQP